MLLVDLLLELYIEVFDLKQYYTLFRDQLNYSFDIADLFSFFLHLNLEGQTMVLGKLGNVYKITEQ